MPQDRRQSHIAMPPWADRRGNHARDIAELFVDGSAAEAWAALGTQPVSALVKPAQPADEQVPIVEIASGPGSLDLDTIASAFATEDEAYRR